MMWMLPLNAGAQASLGTESEMSDTLKILFHVDTVRINMDFGDNRAAWERFQRAFEERYAGKSSRSLRLDIYSGASPEGYAAYNRWLGENRGNSIRRLVQERFGNQIGNIVVHNEAARWDGLYELIAASNEPWRDEALRIIRLPASPDENKRDHREYKLRALLGKKWASILEKYLAPLRSGGSAILSWEPKRDTVVMSNVIVHRDTIIIREVGIPRAADTVAVVAKIAEMPKPVVRWPAWILRTNLPLLGTGTPNVQAEWSLDHRDRWSINVEGVWSWWTFAHNAYANEIMYGSVELRHWLGKRQNHHTLAGWHIGLGVGGGYYDLEWKSEGYQGEAVMGFFNLGWQARFGKRKQWAFDAGIGLGYLYSPYRRYLGSTLFPKDHTEEYDDHLMWQETSRLNWFGTPHANISIGYVFQPRKGQMRRVIARQRDLAHESFLQQRDSIETRRQAERDSIYATWATLPAKERKAARKAYEESLKKTKTKIKTKTKTGTKTSTVTETKTKIKLKDKTGKKAKK